MLIFFILKMKAITLFHCSLEQGDMGSRNITVEKLSRAKTP